MLQELFLQHYILTSLYMLLNVLIPFSIVAALLCSRVCMFCSVNRIETYALPWFSSCPGSVMLVCHWTILQHLAQQRLLNPQPATPQPFWWTDAVLA